MQNEAQLAFFLPTNSCQTCVVFPSRLKTARISNEPEFERIARIPVEEFKTMNVRNVVSGVPAQSNVDAGQKMAIGFTVCNLGVASGFRRIWASRITLFCLAVCVMQVAAIGQNRPADSKTRMRAWFGDFLGGMRLNIGWLTVENF